MITGEHCRINTNSMHIEELAFNWLYACVCVCVFEFFCLNEWNKKKIGQIVWMKIEMCVKRSLKTLRLIDVNAAFFVIRAELKFDFAFWPMSNGIRAMFVIEGKF